MDHEWIFQILALDQVAEEARLVAEFPEAAEDLVATLRAEVGAEVSLPKGQLVASEGGLATRLRRRLGIGVGPHQHRRR